ncbi:hypothetical protein F7725_003988 [Dissostichus mawsoni]|uniref:Uncharacterized protein n=1 Tax=Dissostichus mawsoni TaxID=36200 RepID=A0A7J5YBV3_DISMA|nr:hypothetical protein F7725_003988 [Dissostichus mawsoni]
MSLYKVKSVCFSHRFPFSDSIRLRTWLWNLRIMNWSPSISSRQEEAEAPAVPTIFTFEGEKKKKEVKPRSLRLSEDAPHRPAASPSTQNIVKKPVAVVRAHLRR